MDCDTTGIEPDIALVKYKWLVGGGMLKIVNQTVPLALKTLDYKDEEIDSILEYIDKNETIEGAPKLKEEHKLNEYCLKDLENNNIIYLPIILCQKQILPITHHC